MQLVARLALAAVLAGAALAKLASPRSTQRALATFGVRRSLRSVTWAALVAVELSLAAGVALGEDVAALLAAALLAGFALVVALLVRRGRTGAPCACFGTRSRVGLVAVLRNLALAGGFALLPFVPDDELGAVGWLALGLIASLAGLLALAAVVFALAREVGLLRLRLPPQPALELAGEGPSVGTRAELFPRLAAREGAELALAVFSSPGCPLCDAVWPAVAAVARDPLVAVEVFDEERDADVWRTLRVPGSPYAVALDPEGTVRAKGTFNSFAQLESILAAAERRIGADTRPAPAGNRLLHGAAGG